MAKGIQTTESEGHHWPPSRGSTGDAGGSFRTSRSYVDTHGFTPRQYNLMQQVGLSVHRFRGTAYPFFPNSLSDFPASAESSDSALAADGATAVSRCAPTNSPADVATFIGELYKDGIPSLVGATLWKDRAKRIREHKVANEYLNAQFGWVPLVNDVAKFAKSMVDADTILRQYERNAGRDVRRTYRFPTRKTQSEVVFPDTGAVCNCSSAHNVPNAPFGISRIRSRTTTVSKWFSGAFTYHLPSGYDSRNEMERLALQAKVVHGLTLTPDTLWELAPWSWAVDWFSNTGDVINNISAVANQGLVMRYGYIMEHSVVRDTWSLSRSSVKGTGDLPPIVLVTETKKRVKANPFGFGVSWDGLSSFQASILTALGITRSSR